MSNGCQLCCDTGFDETILCDLNRSAQKEAVGFECGAYRPVLSVAGANERTESSRRAPARRNNPLEERLALAKLMKSDEIQYQRALAQQMLEADPEAVMVQIELHFVWNVRRRHSMFVEAEKHAPVVNEILHRATVPSVRHAGLLWLAPDHIHVYCNADGERSAHDIALRLKGTLERGIAGELPQVARHFDSSEGLWDDLYFVSTVRGGEEAM